MKEFLKYYWKSLTFRTTSIDIILCWTTLIALLLTIRIGYALYIILNIANHL